MAHLSVALAGVEFRTPIGVQPTARITLPEGALLIPEKYAEWLLKTIEFGAGYIYVPGCILIYTVVESRRHPT